MSTFLSGGGVECGPTGVLKNVSTRLDRDTSIRQDRLVSAPPVAGPSNHAFRSSSHTFRPHPVVQSPAQTPFDLSSLRQHLSPSPHRGQYVQPAQVQNVAPSNWAEGFAPQRPIHRASTPSLQQEERKASPWQDDFQRHVSTPAPQAQASIPVVSQGQRPMAPWQIPNRPMYPQPQMFYPQQQNIPHQENLPYQPPGTLYNAVQQNQTAKEDVTSQPLEPLTDAQDVLAKTARSLVDNMTPEITTSNPKLQESKFMALMNGLSSGKFVVEDGELPVNADEVGAGARMVDRAKGTDWASGFLDLEAGSSNSQAGWAQEMANPTIPTTEFVSQNFIPPLSSSAFHHHPANYEYLQDMRSGTQTPERDLQWEAQFEEQEAIIMTERPSSTLHRTTSQKSRKSVHFDEVQDETAEMGNGVPQNLSEAISFTQTSLTGMGSAWEESLDDIDVDAIDQANSETEDHDVFMAYNGPMKFAHDPRLGIGALESWGEMQNDWDSFQRSGQGSTSGGRNVMQKDGPKRYMFQRRNPYASSAEVDRSQTAGILELEAAVQQDPQNSNAWYSLGLKQQENERESQAILALSKSISLDPTNRDAYLAIAVSHTNEGNFSNANEMLEKWIDLGEGLDVGHTSSSGSTGREEGWEMGQKRLVERLIDLARRNPESLDPDVQVALGVLFNSTEEYDKAEDCFEAALSVRPDDWLLYNRLGATLANSGRSSQAIEHYHRALSLHPTFVRALFNLGISYINLSQYPKAAQYILEALRIQKSDSTDSYTTSQLERENGIEKGVMSSTLWNTLRSACLHMNRHDLVALATNRDLSGFPMDIVGSSP